VTEESLKDRLTTDIHAVCLLIQQECRSEIATYSFSHMVDMFFHVIFTGRRYCFGAFLSLN